MTSEEREQPARLLDDERCVDGLLAESGFEDDAELRAVLLQLRSLLHAQVPEPSLELAALMDQSGTANGVDPRDVPRNRAKKRRAVFTSIAVAASLGVAGGAAAGNDTLRREAEGTIGNIVRSFSPPAPTPPPAPAPSEAPDPGSAVVPPPAAATPTANIPTDADTERAPGMDHRSAKEGEDTSEASQHGRKTSAELGTEAPPAVPGTGRKLDGPRSSRPTEAPSNAGQPRAGSAEDPNDGKVKGAQP
jgi:hypothetical protein